MTVAVIGKNSFLARALYVEKQAAGGAGEWRWLGHDEALADPVCLDDVGAVINFAFSPAMMTGGYDAALDVDTKLARRVVESDAHYVMISSRKVYGASAAPAALREDDTVNPDSPYGEAKLTVENSLRDILPGARLSILRPSNIFGVEPGRHTFFGMALSRLRDEGKIVYDFDPSVPRDFMAAWRFSAAILRILDAPKGGVYNLGAGFGTPCGDIAAWLIAGYGAGELVVTDSTARDAFWMDMDKTRAAFGLDAYSRSELEADCVRVGKLLKS